MRQLARAARRFTPEARWGVSGAAILAPYISTSQWRVAVQSPRPQLRALKNYGRANGYSVAHEYVDEAGSVIQSPLVRRV